MPHYEYFCQDCKKKFSKVLTLAEYGKGKIVCPHCGSSKVEQSYSSFFAITSKKSA
ncbi:MAG: zinc ribbon domain-containing protein [Acidobacteria bacterium]|nr:zinc ribbon domain-containing protein [Acidobacteriota bacterium]